jgi:hypothetical protein
VVTRRSREVARRVIYQIKAAALILSILLLLLKTKLWIMLSLSQVEKFWQTLLSPDDYSFMEESDL